MKMFPFRLAALGLLTSLVWLLPVSTPCARADGTGENFDPTGAAGRHAIATENTHTDFSFDPDAALNALDEHLTLSAFNGTVRARLSGLLDLEEYALTRPAPALINSRHAFLFNPRLSFFLDVNIGPRLYGFVQARIDRRFDPSDKPIQTRLDEYFLRYNVLDKQPLTLAVQAGKFATVVGNWTPRHLSWDNPFINAPLPYENITSAADLEAPESPIDFGFFRGGPSFKFTWVPVIWGPSYASGIAAAGQVAEHFDFAFELKNAAISSRPEQWDATTRDWSHPTFSGRLGWRPCLEWNLGVSGSEGAYMTDGAASTLPSGRGLGDYRQLTLGQDIAYAHGHWQVWAEAFESRFQVPNVGDADTFVYYVEARYQLCTELWAGVRWNQQLFGKIPDGFGGEQVWGNNLWRTDLVLGCRLNEHFQAKVQYSYGREHDPGGERGVQVGAVQITTKF
jgi:hypothetical protein